MQSFLAGDIEEIFLVIFLPMGKSVKIAISYYTVNQAVLKFLMKILF